MTTETKHPFVEHVEMVILGDILSAADFVASQPDDTPPAVIARKLRDQAADLAVQWRMPPDTRDLFAHRIPDIT